MVKKMSHHHTQREIIDAKADRLTTKVYQLSWVVKVEVQVER